jgi:pyroglutamyl-peptidase
MPARQARRPSSPRAASVPRVLVTAFEPFDGRQANRSMLWLERFLVRARDAGLAHEMDLAAAFLPVDYVRLPRALGRLWRDERPDLWILTGESGAGDALRVERIAVNLVDAATADNAGRRRRDTPVVRGGPAAYFASVDVRKAVRALAAGGARAGLSMSAGTFCCNQAFYVARHLAASAAAARRAEQRPARVVFLHIPRADLSARRRAPGLDAAAQGLVALVTALARPT